MVALNLRTMEMKAFVPARDFTVSLRFYEALGFTIPWRSEALAYVHHGKASFLLQAFYVPAHAANFQMHLLVENVDDWWQHVCRQRLAEVFDVRVGELTDQPWGMREFVLFDPSGVLWRIAQNLPAPLGG